MNRNILRTYMRIRDLSGFNRFFYKIIGAVQSPETTEEFIYKGRLYLLLTELCSESCPPKLQTSLINSIFIGCGRATRWVGERDNSPKGILENTGVQRRWLGVSGGNPIHGLSSCVKVHRQKAQLGTTFPPPPPLTSHPKMYTVFILWIA